mgnify:CR=1 FL=1
MSRARGVARGRARRRAMTPATREVARVPAPTRAALDACRDARWRATFAAHGFRAVALEVPEDFIRYVLADGVVARETDAAMPRRVAQDAFDAAEPRPAVPQPDTPAAFGEDSGDS